MAKYALLIGINEYQSKPLKPLPGVVKDIEAMQRVLQDSKTGGFDEVKLLTNPDSDAMRSEIEQLFMEKCQTDDIVLLYFSGHGYTYILHLKILMSKPRLRAMLFKRSISSKRRDTTI